jgi:HEAT repeat protein
MTTESTIEELIVQLHHPRDWRVRQEAVKALGEFRTTQAMEAILEALYDESLHVVRTATQQLKRFGKDAAPGMLKALYSPEEIASRRFIIHALDDLSDHDLVPHFIHFLNDDDPDMRYAAALALTKIPDKRAIQPLLNALNVENAPKLQIIKALGAIGDPQVVPHIKSALFDDEQGLMRLFVILPKYGISLVRSRQ